MAVIESKVRRGKLTIDGKEYSCQPTSVSIQPENSGGGGADEIEVLCGDRIVEDDTTEELRASLVITAIQDFTNPDGLVAASWELNSKTVPFTWQPTADAEDTWTGEVKVQALNVGGEVNTRLTSEAEWEIKALTLPARLGGAQVIPAVVAP